jgi:hypothetical protein
VITRSARSRQSGGPGWSVLAGAKPARITAITLTTMIQEIVPG